MKGNEFLDEKGKWIFNESTANVFEDMLQRSIPKYKSMREVTFELCSSFIKDGSTMVDIGCSDGLSLERVVNYIEDNNVGDCKLIGIDISEPMVERARTRFADNDNVSIDKVDLRYEFIDGKFDLFTSILTLQFIPIEYRQQILRNIYISLNSGGALLMVEKVLGGTFDINELYIKEYYKIKNGNGYSEEEVDTKRRALEGVLVPLTTEWNYDLLKQAGFKKVDMYWKYLNFEGYLAIKE